MRTKIQKIQNKISELINNNDEKTANVLKELSQYIEDIEHPIYSPCTKLCKVQDGICVGCFRSLDEIANWRGMNKTEKMKVLENIEFRKLQK